MIKLTIVQSVSPTYPKLYKNKAIGTIYMVVEEYDDKGNLVLEAISLETGVKMLFSDDEFEVFSGTVGLAND